MSAFGSAISKYYVHYRAQSYLYSKDNSFNAKNSETMIEYAKSKLATSSKNLKSSMSKNKKAKYLNALNALMGRKNNLTQQQQTLANDYYKDLENLLIEKNNDIIIDRISGEVATLSSNHNKPAYKTNKQKIAMSKESAEDFVKKFNQITNYISKEVSNGTLAWKNDTRLNKSLDEVLQLTEEMNKSFQEMSLIASKEIGKTNAPQSFKNLTKQQKLTSKNWLVLDDKWKNYIDTFNILAENYNLVFDTAKLLQGTHFENILAAAAELVFGVGTEKIIDTVQDMVEGSDLVSAQFLMDGVSTDVWKQLNIVSKKGFETTVNGVKTYIRPNYSQGKVDVRIDYNKGVLNRTGKPVNISAKSIKGLSSIGVVKSTTADAIIDRENNQYKKMYLNIMADRDMSLEKIFGISSADNKKYYTSLLRAEEAALQVLDSQRQHAILSFKILAAYKALTGDVLGRKAAEVFIVNDVATQKIYFIEMKDIISAILTELQQDARKISKFFHFTSAPNDFSSTYYLNEWVQGEDGEVMRIANLLNDVHAHKIEVAFRGNDTFFRSIGMSIDASGKITNH